VTPDEGTRVRAFAAFILLVAVSATTRSARAQVPHDPAAADALFNRGKELLAAGHWPEACAKFRASLELDPSIGTELKVAKCHEHEGKLALALHEYDAALAHNRERTDQTIERRQDLERFTQNAIALLEPRVPKLRVILLQSPAGLRVRHDGVDLPLAAVGEALPVDPGPADIVAEAPGFGPERRTVVLREGETLDVRVTLRPLTAPPPSAQGTLLAHRAAAPWWTTRRAIGAPIAGAGIVALGLSAIFAVETRSKLIDAGPYCTPTYECTSPGVTFLNQARTYQTTALVSLVVGVVLAGVGVGLLVAPSSGAPTTVSVGVSPLGGELRGQW
jgi:hypothetical protein